MQEAQLGLHNAAAMHTTGGITNYSSCSIALSSKLEYLQLLLEDCHKQIRLPSIKKGTQLLLTWQLYVGCICDSCVAVDATLLLALCGSPTGSLGMRKENGKGQSGKNECK
jgi:hypothetical protein